MEREGTKFNRLYRAAINLGTHESDARFYAAQALASDALADSASELLAQSPLTDGTEKRTWS